MTVIITPPQVGIEKKGNVYLTVSKPKELDGKMTVFLRIGVCTEATSYEKSGYAYRAFMGSFYSYSKNSLERKCTIIQDYNSWTCNNESHRFLCSELLQLPENFREWLLHLQFQFKVIAGFIIPYNERKTLLENAFACHIARMCKEAEGDTKYYLISNYASKCKPEVYDQVTDWLKNRNITTIKEFIDWVDASTPECRASFDQYRFA
jgi:hypothetical protein